MRPASLSDSTTVGFRDCEAILRRELPRALLVFDVSPAVAFLNELV